MACWLLQHLARVIETILTTRRSMKVNKHFHIVDVGVIDMPTIRHSHHLNDT